jgi:hypothetical protein
MNHIEVPESLQRDRDALHILPLCDLPLETPALRRARLIKNVRLESMVEIFSDADSGSGQLSVEDLPTEFGWDIHNPPNDLKILRALGLMPSYDVYSLRLALREHDIEVNSINALKLSSEKNQELAVYMKDFTHPLIGQIYGSDNVDIQDFSDVIKLFRDPDVKNALEKLKVMAEKLEIKPDQIPRFMEDYGDIFLSLSYYRQGLDAIEPIITEFIYSLDLLRSNYQFKNDMNLMNTVDMMESVFNNLMVNISGRFENFERGTKHMWDKISAERFRRVESLISSYHITIGGVLCALSVKMNAWDTLFPNKDTGGPGRRAEFILSEMRQGIEKMQKVEDSAPVLAALDGD